MFCPILTVLGKCMATRYTAFGENLWRSAASVFNSVVNLGLPAVNKAYYNPQEQTPPTKAWAGLAEVLEWFLLGRHPVAIDIATGTPVSDQPTTSEAAPDATSAAVSQPNTPTPAASSPAAAADASQASPALQGAPDSLSSQAEAPSLSGPDIAEQPVAGSLPTRASVDQQQPSSAPPADDGLPSDQLPPASGMQTSRSQQPSRAPSRDPSFKAVLADTEQSSSDAELENSVVDMLTDAVLTACSHAPEELKRRLIAVLDQAIVRPKTCHIPDSAAGLPHCCSLHAW